MATASSVIEICNGALIKLGESILSSSAEIDSSTATTTKEKILSNRFDRSCRRVLGLRAWPSATQRSDITSSQAAVTDFEDFDYYYDLPAATQFVRLNGVILDDLFVEGTHSKLWRISLGKFYTSYSTSVHILYNYWPGLTHLTANNATWDAYFQEISDSLKNLMECAIALDTCMAFTENATLRKVLHEEYRLAQYDAIQNESTHVDNMNVYPIGLLMSRA